MGTNLRERKGSVLIYTVALMLILLFTAGSFMKWAADEAYQARFDLARSQAYYIAQLGAIEQGMSISVRRKSTSWIVQITSLPMVQACNSVSFPVTTWKQMSINSKTFMV